MKPEPRHIEAMRELRFVAFDFDGVFTDNAVWVDEEGCETVRCSRWDGFGLQSLHRLGLGMVVLSTEINPVVGRRCLKLKIDCVQACEDKATTLRRLVAEFGTDLARTAFVGNDVNDKPALEIVGLPVIVADAHPSLKRSGYLQTRLPGGHGAVREFCDLVASMRQTAASHG